MRRDWQYYKHREKMKNFWHRYFVDDKESYKGWIFIWFLVTLALFAVYFF